MVDVDKEFVNLNIKMGKYVEENICEPIVVCDRSGFNFLASDVEEQMVIAGNSVVGTGLFVGKPFLDELNETDRPFKVNPNEFKPINHPRPIQYTTEPNVVDDPDFQVPLDLYANKR